MKQILIDNMIVSKYVKCKASLFEAFIIHDARVIVIALNMILIGALKFGTISSSGNAIL